ncbi:MAG: rRNA maturation RNase YbeY [Chlamydiia bacterium]|nr:rRNA maturation RNase YbeY [Chlamydiia bacterium]
MAPRINIYNQQRTFPLSRVSVRKAVETLISFLSISCDECSLYFVSTKKITALHAEFFEDPTPTDCITFPIDSSYLGDLFVCPDAAITFAASQNRSPYQELLLYIVHGFLHLLGYDDIDPISRRSMRKMEKQCMDHLSKLDVQLTPP